MAFRGVSVVAAYGADGAYYEAEVTQDLGDTCVVRYLGYGDAATLPKAQTRPMPQLPQGWARGLDARTGFPFYTHVTSGAATWDRPAAAQTLTRPAPAPRPTAAPRPVSNAVAPRAAELPALPSPEIPSPRQQRQQKLQLQYQQRRRPEPPATALPPMAAETFRAADVGLSRGRLVADMGRVGGFAKPRARLTEMRCCADC